MLQHIAAVWTDPEFDPAQRAFYYARILENPVCRWSTLLCNELGVDCSDPSTITEDAGQCCHPVLDNQRSIQERAWSSPIWYKP